jgi:mannose-6-phosphate isomerase-like protein (cupin superfamily)
MRNWQELLESGLLELYVLEQASPEEVLLVEQMALIHPEISQEIEEISLALEKYAQNHAIEPDPVIKPFLMATIDFSERMKMGERPELAPVLHENAASEDYKSWLDRPDMILPDDFQDIYAKIISYTPEMITAIVWIKHMAPQEVHDHEFERFLILEGTCDIYIEGKICHLAPGDYLQIPLHKPHRVVVTSEVPCKVILQRVAA